MYPVRVLSLNNSWTLLSQDKEAEWKDIQDTLLEFDGETLRNLKLNDESDENINKLSEEDKARRDAEMSKASYIAMVMELAIANKMQSKGWNIINEVYDTSKIIDINKGVEKNKVFNFILNTNYSSGSFNDIFYVSSQISRGLGLSEITCILVPDETVFQGFNNEDGVTIFAPFYEMACREKIKGLSKLNNSAPVAVIFYSAYKQDIEVEEVPLDGAPSVDRAIVFPPEYYQAGVTVLSHFGQILRQKYPDINAKVRIEQEDNIVRMHIELPDGETNIVEEVLEKYILVVREKASPDTLFDNKLQIMALENKLDLIKAELKSSERALQFALENRDEMKKNHEKAVLDFQRLIGEQSSQINTLLQLSSQYISSNERIQLAYIGHAQNLFKDLIGEAHGNQILLNAIRSFEYNLMSGIATVDAQEQIREALGTIQQNKPNMLEHIAAQLESAEYGALASVAIEWIKQHCV